MPTLYHHFGNKQGLTEAVIAHGFDLYLGQKAGTEASADPIHDIRRGWDVHVDFGVANPGFYALMYGSVRPGYIPDAQARASDMLLALTRRAAEQGRLTVTPERAAAHILSANIGVTLRQIALASPDPDLSAEVRDGVLAAITGTPDHDQGSRRDDALRLLSHAAAHPDILGADETRLLQSWLLRLSQTEAAAAE